MQDQMGRITKLLSGGEEAVVHELTRLDERLGVNLQFRP